MAEAEKTGSIVPDKYKGKYKGASDWVGEFIESQCNETPEGAKKSQLNVNRLFDLAEANGINVDKFKGQENAAGRMRMTIGNSLRATARKRHGLKTIAGKNTKAPAEFIEAAVEKFGAKYAEPQEKPDGTRIVAKADKNTEDDAGKKAA